MCLLILPKMNLYNEPAKYPSLGFEVVTAKVMKMGVIWDVISRPEDGRDKFPRNFGKIYTRFHSVTSQNATNFSL
jgi:hypothetical protein